MRRARCARCKKVWEDESSLKKKVLENQTLIKGILGDCAPATSGMICDRFPHVPPTRRPILARTSAWNDSRRRQRRDSPAIPERTSLARSPKRFRAHCLAPDCQSPRERAVFDWACEFCVDIPRSTPCAFFVSQRRATCHRVWLPAL